VTAFGEYETPSGVEVSDRQPANCPYCGYDGGFDGLGPFHGGYKSHCPDCGLAFVTFVPDTDDG
jgi:hypothetical protein